MRVWRVCQRQYATFDGEGSRRAGGRWTHRGVAVVYTSATLSLAWLELLLALEHSELPGDMVAISADIPDDVRRSVLDISVPSNHWRRYPSTSGLRDVGTRWMTSMDTAVLAVPSVIVPAERNYLLNPAHPAFRQIQIGTPEPLVFHARDPAAAQRMTALGNRRRESRTR
jgi:RES domain-containing protein